MTPQLVDLDADGYQDMVMATFEGTAFVVRGTKEGWQKPKHIEDKAGTNVRISKYFDLEEEDYREVDRSDSSYESNPEHHMTSIALVDWDADGDQDLVLGAYEGALYLCRNNGSPKKPEFAETNEQLKVAGKPMVVDGGLATPRIVDFNRDGLFDIVCGGSKGGVYLFQNKGKKGEPSFESIKTLVPKFAKKKTASNDDEDDFFGTLVPCKDGVPTFPAEKFHIDVVDYDQDGDLDLLVGGTSFYQTEEKKLTEEEEKELAELRKKVKESQLQTEKLMAGKEPEEMEELFQSDEFEKMNREMDKVWDRIEDLSPGIRSESYIWLYRNKSGAGKASAANPTGT